MSKFEGLWKLTRDNLETGKAESIEYTFARTGFVCKIVHAEWTDTFSGTFTFTDTAITFIILDVYVSWTQDYTINGPTLTLFGDPDGHYSGEFLKK